MIKKVLFIGCMIIHLSSFGQVNELEKFRQEITLFVNYENGKIDSLPTSTQISTRLYSNYVNAFLDFVKHKDSKNLDELKKHSIDNKTSYIINDHNYFFNTIRKDLSLKSLENNVYYQIVLYALYDYNLSNFVSFYIQPFSLGTSEYVIYYCHLNGKGNYYIKDVKSNQVLFEGQGLTSNMPIKKFVNIDSNHILIIEDIGVEGERALVINTTSHTWKAMNAFYGKAMINNAKLHEKSMNIQKRRYLKFEESKTIIALYGKEFLKNYEMDFDEISRTISYKEFKQNESKMKLVEATWKNNLFQIDDYFIGKDLDNSDMPMPTGE